MLLITSFYLLVCFFVFIDTNNQTSLSTPTTTTEKSTQMTATITPSNSSNITDGKITSIDVKADNKTEAKNTTDNPPAEPKYNGLIDNTLNCINMDYKISVWGSLDKCLMDGCFGCHNKPCPFCVDKTSKCIDAFKFETQTIIDAGIAAMVGIPTDQYRLLKNDYPVCKKKGKEEAPKNETTKIPETNGEATTEVIPNMSNDTSSTTEIFLITNKSNKDTNEGENITDTIKESETTKSA